MVNSGPVRRPALAPVGRCVALCVALAGCYESRTWPEGTGEAEPRPEDDGLAETEDASANESVDDMTADGIETADADPYALPTDCEPVFPDGSVRCRDGMYCPDEWSLCCVTNLCGPPGINVRGCCDDTSCGHAILPFGLFSCIGAVHDGYLRVADCSECPAGYAFCCDHTRAARFCTNERPYAWFCRELGG